MKKAAAVLLAVIFTLTLCACGESGEGVSSAEVSSAESVTKTALLSPGEEAAVKKAEDTSTAYKKFLAGELLAADGDSGLISINDIDGDIPSPVGYGQYAIYDMNGDSTPELIVSTNDGLNIFWMRDGQLSLWRSDTSYCYPLNNGAILYISSSRTPDNEHICYQYAVAGYSGEDVLRITFAEYKATEAGGESWFFVNDERVSKETYDTVYKFIMDFNSDSHIGWKPLANGGYIMHNGCK